MCFDEWCHETIAHNFWKDVRSKWSLSHVHTVKQFDQHWLHLSFSQASTMSHKQQHEHSIYSTNNITHERPKSQLEHQPSKNIWGFVRLHHKRSNMFGELWLRPPLVKPKSNRFDFIQPNRQLSNGCSNSFIHGQMKQQPRHFLGGGVNVGPTCLSVYTLH